MPKRRPLYIQADPAFRTRRANPYNALLYEQLAAGGARVAELSVARLALAPPDIVHIHWPELTFLSGRKWWRTAWRVTTFSAALAVARARRRTKLVWTVHNLTPHEHRPSNLQDRLFWWLFPRQVDGILTLTASAQESVREAYPPLQTIFSAVTPHGDYRDVVDRTLTRDQARRYVGVDPDARLLVFVGQVRPYKNVPALLEAFARVSDDRARLVVAGQARPGPERTRVKSLAEKDPRVRLELDFQTPSQLSSWLAAADAVVLPYSEVLNSGTALLALSADRPVVVPRLGAIPELHSAVGDEWVFPFDGALEEALRQGLDWAVKERRTASPDLSNHSWPRVAALTEEAMRLMLDPGSRGPIDDSQR